MLSSSASAPLTLPVTAQPWDGAEWIECGTQLAVRRFNSDAPGACCVQSPWVSQKVTMHVRSVLTSS